jgi:hypothetical protein
LVEDARTPATEAAKAWRTMMAIRGDYMAGWINTTIHDFLEEIDEPTSSMRYALITYLDSSSEVSSIFTKGKHLIDLRSKYRAIGTGALLTTRQLIAAQRQRRIFFGFDEVWFFPSPDISSKPESLVITAPYSIDSEQIEQYSEWLTSNRCSLGLGDGMGMNYCLRIRGVARYIVQAINESNPHLLNGERESA